MVKGVVKLRRIEPDRRSGSPDCFLIDITVPKGRYVRNPGPRHIPVCTDRRKLVVFRDDLYTADQTVSVRIVMVQTAVDLISQNLLFIGQILLRIIFQTVQLDQRTGQLLVGIDFIKELFILFQDMGYGTPDKEVVVLKQLKRRLKQITGIHMKGEKNKKTAGYHQKSTGKNDEAHKNRGFSAYTQKPSYKIIPFFQSFHRD